MGSVLVPHHCVALAGYTTSEIAHVFALANAVNTWITEIGSLLYQLFLLAKGVVSPATQRRLYALFVLVYAATRAYFAHWSLTVFRHVQIARAAPEPWDYPWWAPFDAALLQVLLLLVNLAFLWTHLRKLAIATFRGSKAASGSDKAGRSD